MQKNKHKQDLLEKRRNQLYDEYLSELLYWTAKQATIKLKRREKVYAKVAKLRKQQVTLTKSLYSYSYTPWNQQSSTQSLKNYQYYYPICITW